MLRFENFKKFEVGMGSKTLVKYYYVALPATLRAPSFSVYSLYDFLSDAVISGGRVRCPWYFLFAHAASGPESPCAYESINLAARFAYLKNVYK